MKMREARIVAARQEEVWNGLLDPKVLMASIPGCTELSGSPETGFKAIVVQRVGPVKATFKGTVRLSDIDEPNSVRLQGEGNGGPAGFCNGGATVYLSPADNGTAVRYDVDAKVGGKLAQLGSRVIDSFARKMADRFFDNFQKEVETASVFEPAPSREHQPEPPAEVAEEPKAKEPKKGWFRKLFR